MTKCHIERVINAFNKVSLPLRTATTTVVSDERTESPLVKFIKLRYLELLWPSGGNKVENGMRHESMWDHERI